MNCHEMKDVLPLHASGLLEPDEEARVRAHLAAGCPACAGEAAALRHALDLLPFALPPADPSPMARARLLSVIEAEPSSHAARAPGRGRLIGVAAAAAILAGILVGGALTIREQARSSRYEGMIASLQEEVARQREEVVSLQREIRTARESIQMASAPGVTIVDLAGQEPLGTAVARIFWDRERDTWQLYARGLPAAAAGRTYQLWLVTQDEKISAGVFDVRAPLPAAGSVTLPEGAGRVIAAAVTEEPEGGSPQPTGSILLIGNI